MANETTYFFGAFMDVEVLPHDYELIVRQCPNKHFVQMSWEYCPVCGELIIEQSIAQRRYTTDHYELLDDYLAETLTDTTPRDMYGTGHIVLRSNIDGDIVWMKTVWLEIDRYSSGLPVLSFPTDAEQEDMKRHLMAFPAVRALQNHPQVASVTVRCGYVEDAEY